MALGQGRGPFKCRRCGHEFTPKRGNKHHAERSEVGGTVFDSKAERRYLTENLAWRLRAKEIANLRIKPRYELEPGIHYRPEATYDDLALGHPVTVEVKGASTKGGRFPTIVHIWRNHMDHPLHVVEYDYRRKMFHTTRKIIPRKMGST